MKANTYTNRYGGRITLCPEHFQADVDAQRFVGAPFDCEPTETDCPECPEAKAQRAAAAEAKLLAAVSSPHFAYSRAVFTSPQSAGRFCVYHRDPSSPSGVRHAASTSLAEAKRLGLAETCEARVWR